jgi:hypothetical protein
MIPVVLRLTAGCFEFEFKENEFSISLFIFIFVVFVDSRKMSAKFTCQKFFTKDTKITDFDAKVYDACLKIPKGTEN